jgi:hypothetical protein
MWPPSIFSYSIVAVAVLAQMVSGRVDALPNLPSAPSTCPPPTPPSSFWGYVTLDGAAAPVGQPLAAWIEGSQVASTTTQSAGGLTYYQMDVPARAYDDVTGLLCRPGGAPGEMVMFVLANSLPANETGVWAGGTLVQRNLTLSSCSPYDFDCNCHIEVDDIGAVAGRWSCLLGDACYDSDFDFDDDDDVDVVDIMRVAARWGCTCGDACYAGVAEIRQ